MKRLSFIALALLTACEVAPLRREEYIAKHPEWEPKMVALIRDGRIAKGMTKEQVRAAWGRPCPRVVCQGTTRGAWGESWEYDTQIVFFDTQGKVIRWEPK
ncbi:MAG: outer membrane protein assembly factor BamE [Methylohalobius sp.]|nr:outer membrane protein assembly factor BamE [Methylohalobius sp.]